MTPLLILTAHNAATSTSLTSSEGGLLDSHKVFFKSEDPLGLSFSLLRGCVSLFVDVGLHRDRSLRGSG